MEKKCNVVSLTKVQTSEISSSNVEFDKVLNAILSNNQYIQFDTNIKEEYKEKIYDLLNKLTEDIIDIHNTIVSDLTLDLNYKHGTCEFEITVNFLQTGQTLDSKLFYYAIEYYDKYEEYIIMNDLADVISIDFNTMTKNENLHIITKFTGGKVE